MIVVNGQVVAQGSQFSLDDVEVVTTTVDLEEVRAFRFAPNRSLQAVRTPEYRRIKTSFSLSLESVDLNPDLAPSPPREIRYHLPEEEIAMGRRAGYGTTYAVRGLLDSFFR
jgi:NAD+ synthase (glutamine-hydrolysing)